MFKEPADGTLFALPQGTGGEITALKMTETDEHMIRELQASLHVALTARIVAEASASNTQRQATELAERLASALDQVNELREAHAAALADRNELVDPWEILLKFILLDTSCCTVL